MWCAFFLQEVVHVFQVFHVATLIGGHGNGLGIFLNGAIDHFFNRAVVAKVYHFAAGGLNDAAHDVDSGIVTVEKCRSSDNADFMLWDIRLNLFHRGF